MEEAEDPEKAVNLDCLLDSVVYVVAGEDKMES